MNKIICAGACLLLSLVMLPVYADKDNTSFAYEAELSHARSLVRKLELPVQVLQQIQRPDMGDLRVLDADDQVMETRLERKVPSVEKLEADLRLFPLYDKSQTATDVVRLQKSDKTSVVTIQTQTKHAQPENKHPYAYLLENSIRNQFLNKLRLKWQQQDASHVILLTLDSSDDLQHWRTLKSDVVLAKLAYGDNHLLKNQIDLPAVSSAYLRMTLNQGADDFVPQQVTGEYYQNAVPQTLWMPVAKLRRDSHSVNTWLFDIHSGIRSTRMRLVFPSAQDYFVSAELYSRRNDQSPWRTQNPQIIQYQLRHEQLLLDSESFGVASEADNEWRMVMLGEQATTDLQAVSVAMEVPQYELAFIARGRAPYRLQWGNGNARSQPQIMRSLLAGVKKRNASIDSVSIKQTQQLLADVSHTDEGGMDGKKAVIWLVLVAGVLVAGFMAYQLRQEMSQSDDS